MTRALPRLAGIRRPGLAALPSILLLAGTWVPSIAAIHVPDDYPSIGLALQFAMAGDSVVVACGTYEESGLQLRPGVTLLSEAGVPECVTIEGNYGGSILVCQGGPELARIDGLTLTRGGWLSELFANGGGLNAQNCSVAVNACRFESNYGGQKGGGIYASGSTITVSRTDFFANRGTGSDDGGGEGGAIYAYDSEVQITDCRFLDNHSDVNLGGSGGAIRCSSSDLSIAGSRFEGNWTYGVGGAIDVDGSTVTIVGTAFEENWASFGGASIAAGSGFVSIATCIFSRAEPLPGISSEVIAGNQTPLQLSHSTLVGAEAQPQYVLVSGGSNLIISHCILIVPEGVAATDCNGTTPVFSCCDIYSPSGNAWLDCYADQLGVNSNISADPQFCGEAGSGNYYLQSDSPCAPANSPCGELIGALPVGCEAVATKASSISAIKALY
jgi:predicted outer membrane repeat protein